jgi:multiple sugar transport system permease protein
MTTTSPGTTQAGTTKAGTTAAGRAEAPGTARRGVLQLVLIISCFVSIFPILWMLLTSVKTQQETLVSPPVWIPTHPTLDSYRRVADSIDLGSSFLNSLIIAVCCTIGVVVTSLLAGYVFAKKRFRGRGLLFAVMIATMFLPPIVTLIPLYRIASALGLHGSLLGIIVPNLANAFGIFLLRQFIVGVPDELLEAARLEGCSEFRIVFRIVAPVITPALAALTLFSFVYYWQSYLWPLTVLGGDKSASPIVLSLSQLLSYTGSAQNTGLVMAGASLAVLPPLVLFVFLQRYFVNSIANSGITGQ